MKLLIGYDGSPFAAAAIDDLWRAGLPREAKAIILTVSELWLPYKPVDHVTRATPLESSVSTVNSRNLPSGAKPVTEAHALALEGKRRLQAQFAEWEIQAEELAGSPAREILKRADDWKPQLIVVGSQGRSGLGRFLLGSVSQKVVNEAHCSVRVVRGRSWRNSSSPSRILIALDGSPGSAEVVKAVSTRMWTPGSEVRLITIVDAANGSRDSSNVTSHVWVQSFLDLASKQLRDVHLTVSTSIDEGDPKHLIIANALEWGAESIFIGASGERKQQLREFLLGSVATAVVSRAHCAVEVVRDGF